MVGHVGGEAGQEVRGLEGHVGSVNPLASVR